MRKVTFTVSTGFVGSRKTDTYTLEQLGIDESLEGEELEKELEEAHKEWIWDNIDTSFIIE